MTTSELTRRVWDAIDRRAEEIIGLGERIRTHPLFRETASTLVGAEHYREIGHRTGSTDMGDLSQVKRVLHPYVGGARGTGHAADYAITDRPLAYVVPAKALAAMVIDLLADGGAGSREVLRAALPPMTREQYLTFQRGLGRREVYEA